MYELYLFVTAFTIDIIHGTGLETHPINTFLMASPCYGGRGHVTCALFGIMAGVATAIDMLRPGLRRHLPSSYAQLSK